MTTPLDLAELRSLAPLAAANYLTARTMNELRGLCDLLGLKVKAKPEKLDLVNAVLSATHAPQAATPPAAASFEQTRFA